MSSEPRSARVRRSLGLTIGAAILLHFSVSVTPAVAHPGHSHALDLSPDGRLPGQADLEKTGNTTYRFDSEEKRYEIRKPGQRPAFAHVDPMPPDVLRLAFSEGGGQIGGWVTLPPSELDPVCRTSGPRVAFVHTHRPFLGVPGADFWIRSIAERMNWKINDQASKSSGGTRAVKLFVDCTGGQINVHDVAVWENTYAAINSAVQQQLSSQLGQGPIKYLAFDAGSAGQAGGIAPVVNDNRKGWYNANALTTGVGVVYSAGWFAHVPVHELLHLFGASQGSESPPAPFSTPGYHCNDGFDVLCYSDGTGGVYSEASCPKSGGYDTPVGVPVDCNYDTYFNAKPEPGTWLAKYWNVAGHENPYLAGPPLAITGPPTSEAATSADLGGEIDSGGYDTTFYVKYGTTTSYGSVAPGGVIPGPTPEVPVGIQLTGLQPNTTYHYRVVATNVAGSSNGSDLTVTTTAAPPVAITEPAASETDTGATLKGKVNPEGLATTYQFEYGTTTAYGSKAPVPAGSAGSSTNLVDVSRAISGLVKGVTYHYRLTATNAEGTVLGGDMTFVARKVVEYSLPSGGRAIKIAPGPDGTMWFTAQNPSRIGKVTTAGTITEYPVAEGSPVGIVGGPDGNLWFANSSKSRIGKITPAGVITEYPTPTKFANPMDLTVGPDGNLWATEQDPSKIARVTTAGAITEYALPSQPKYRWPLGIAAGPDGNLWYASINGWVGKMSTAGTLLAEYVPPAFTSGPRYISQGPDGNLWYTSQSSAVGKVTTAGAFTWYAISSRANSIASGPDGNMWLTMFEAGKIARVTTTGTVTEYAVGANPAGVAKGPDGKMWFTTYSGKVGKIAP